MAVRTVIVWTAGLLLFLQPSAVAKVVDFERDAGGRPDDPSNATVWHNGAALNSSLNALQPGDRLIIPNKTFHLMGGIIADNLESVTIQLDGTLVYSDDLHHWPRQGNGLQAHVLECLSMRGLKNVTFTSTGMGLMDGKGQAWWGIPGIGYLVRTENRPRLFEITGSDLLFENIILKNSPYWTFWGHDVNGLEIRNAHVDNRRDRDDGHDIIDLTAFNTDGFDVTGNNIWIHDSSVWNDDDTFCIKDGTTNVVVERVQASGLGLTIGSIGGGSTVRNVTFRDVTMHHTWKGVYMKFRGNGHVSDVTYENIVIEEPENWPIWIGPAQQSDTRELCAAHPCSNCWPQLPTAKCDAPSHGIYINITLRNITVINPKFSPGVILANATSPIVNITFEDVIVHGAPSKPFNGYYCPDDGIKTGYATGRTSPVPACFTDMTTTVTTPLGK